MTEVQTSKVLPTQLQDINFGFREITQQKSKNPLRKIGRISHIHTKKFNRGLMQGGNYGVLGGCGDLIVIDADTPEIDEVVKSKLQPTFTVKTPRCGHHYYYICKDIENKIVLKTGEEHFGEIISKGSQVVGPGSIHPDTGTEYEVVNDVEIAEISKEEIFIHLAEYIPSNGADENVFNELIKEYGEPYYLEKNKVSGINESFWAGLHNVENIQLYEPTEKAFLQI